ncbi:MAG TPA: class I SAM-dependent methyltransferase [Chitinophagaceae bacterium]
MRLSDLKKLVMGSNGFSVEKEPAEAYDLWAGNYDNQPGNLMLDLDEIIFTLLFNDVNAKNKFVADIGCGTGRHWQKIYAKHPAKLTGFDISEGMLSVLKQKFPQSITSRITDNLFKDVHDASFDLIISTLTIAHIKNINEAINTWCRILENDGEMIITDFHPELLAKGGRRSFTHDQKHFYVTNYIHSLDKIKTIFSQNGFTVKREEERFVDDTVKEYYTKQNALHVFEKFKGMPVIYGIHLKRTNGIK